MLKLIREAETLSKLDAHTLAAFTVLKQASGKKSITEVMESFRPTPENYAKWLDVIIGYAEDAGLPLHPKAKFDDVAGAVLENGDYVPIEMHDDIINKLHADYKAHNQHAKAHKHHAKIEKIAQAQEEEEAANRPDDEPEIDFSFGDSKSDSEDDVCPSCGHTMHHDDDHDECDMDGHDDLGDRVSGAEELGRMGNKPYGHVGDEPMAYQEEESSPRRPAISVKTYGVPKSRSDRKYNVWDDKSFEDKYGGDEQAMGSRERSQGHEEEESQRGPMSAKPGQEVDTQPKSKSILHQVLTGPKDDMNAALKDIEADGSAAWTAHKLPTNPHTKGSIAHRKWATGLKKAMKTHLGLDAVPVAKPKKR